MSLAESFDSTLIMKAYRRIRRWFRRRFILHRVYLTRENLEPAAHPNLTLDPKFVLRPLRAEDLPELERFRPEVAKGRYAEFFNEDKFGFGIFENERLIATTWINFEDFNSIFYSRPLKPDEVYLFDAFSDPDYRGSNFAPLLRLHCYDMATERGRSKIYSLTDYDNTPALRFKQKLGAIQESVHIFVGRRRPLRGHTFRLKQLVKPA